MLELPISSPVHAENAGLFVSPGYGIHPDRVIPGFELIFVRKGRLSMEENGASFELAAGQTLILWPGRRHRGAAPYERDLSFYWIHFYLPPRLPRARPAIRIEQTATPERPDRLAELFHWALSEQEDDTLATPQGDTILSLMLMEAARAHADPQAARPGGAAALAANFVAEHFHEGITAGDVAAALRLHPDYLGRVYRRAFGQTLTEAIHRRQVREARGLLRETGLNIDEIARACGFTDARYFRRVFSRVQGVNPLRYRREQREIHINTR